MHLHRIPSSSRRRSGFTLIELLLVVCIIGILAAIAVPKFGSTKQRAYKTAMISDLRSLLTAEETFFQDSSKYASLSALQSVNGYQTSAGVNPPDVQTGAGYWYATVTHAQVAAMICGVAFGTTNPIASAAAEGEPACK